MKYYTCDRETWTIIDEFATLEEAMAEVKKYEKTDKEEGTYEQDFYDVIDDNKVSYLF